MRRQAHSSTIDQDLRIDPFALPARYSAALAGPAQPAPASVYLDRSQAIVKRRVGGVPATFALPVRAFRGVAVRMEAHAETGQVRTTIELMHRDPALSVPLVVVEDLGDGEDIAADWQAWGRTLGLPLLIVEGDGTVREAVSRLGGVAVDDAKPRRAPASLTGRRPRFLKRRKMLAQIAADRLDGREIIARD